MKIVISGLSLSGNKGAPALAWSIMEQIDNYTSSRNEYIFIVPSFTYENDLLIASKNPFISVIKRISLLESIYVVNKPLYYLFKVAKYSRLGFRKLSDSRLEGLSLYKDSLKSCDIWINENGISFVGDGTKSIVSALCDYIDDLLPWHFCKNYFRYTQSYGPFTKSLKGRFIATMAKLTLKNHKVLFARGRSSFNTLSELLPNKCRIINFPDIAITLTEELDGYKELVSESGYSNYVCIIPSVVISKLHSPKKEASDKNIYIELIKMIIDHRIQKGDNIVILPHTIFGLNNLNECDLVLSRSIYQNYINKKQVFLVDTDYDCKNLKGIISKADFVYTSRYHGLVAALSSGIDTIALGWNDKYEDLAEYYIPFRITVDCRSKEKNMLIREVYCIEEKYKTCQNKIPNKRNKELIEESIRLLLNGGYKI